MNLIALVLAGGLGKRIGGEKEAKSLWGKPLLYWAIKPYSELRLKIALSVRDPHQEASLKGLLKGLTLPIEEFLFFQDEPSFKGQGPLSGLYSAMLKVPKDTLLIASAVDQPLLEVSLLKELISLGEVFLSFAVLCEKEDKPEPLPGIYPASLLTELRSYLRDSPKWSLKGFLSYLSSKNLLVTFKSWPILDPKGQSFVNINSLVNLEKVATCFYPRQI